MFSSTLSTKMGGCYATDKITVDGMKIGYMYREEPDEVHEWVDSGWRFLSGTESQDYIEDANNTMIYNVNTIANYDKAIIPYLYMPFGSQLERIEGTNEFKIVKD